MKGTRWFIATMLAPAFFFLICFYLYPTVFNIANSLTDLSLFGLKRGGARVGVDNYLELVTSPDFRRVLWNTVIWLTAVGVTVRLAAGLGLALLLTSRTIRKYRLQTVCRVLLLVPWATPPDRRDPRLAVDARYAGRRHQRASDGPRRGRPSDPVSGECRLGVAGADHDHHLEHASTRHLDLYRQPRWKMNSSIRLSAPT